MSKKIKYDKILILDLEFLCWEKQQDKPTNIPIEIIEIGLCVFCPKTLSPSKKRSILVRPDNIDHVSPYCEELTGHTKEDLDNNGVSLLDASIILREDYRSNRYGWASWGASDRTVMENDCLSKDVPFPLTSRHINIQSLFPIVFGLSHECSLETALELLKMPFEGRQHNGGDDAWNTAKILGECLRGGGLPMV